MTLNCWVKSLPVGKYFQMKCAKFFICPKDYNITVGQVYVPITNAEEAEVEQFYEDLQDLLELTPKKKKSFLSRGTGMQK